MKKQILDIASIIFDDDDFKELESFLNNDDYASIAGFINEHKELTDILLSFDDDNIELKTTINRLDVIEKCFISLYLGSLKTELINE